jgi:hypothetical protein
MLNTIMGQLKLFNIESLFLEHYCIVCLILLYKNFKRIVTLINTKSIYH